MKITFSQSGGFAGLVRGYEVDTHALPRDEAAEIETLVKNSGILRAQGGHSEVGRDLFGYRITIETDECTRRVEFDDSTIPDGARPLLDLLTKRAGPRPLK